jgi:Ca-activated chloride channel homolog
MREQATSPPATKFELSRKLFLLGIALAFVSAGNLRAQSPQQAEQQQTVIPPPPPPVSQDQSHRIRQNVDMVVLHATVTDKKGNFVPNLQKENFRVYEDKVEQRIAVFQRRDIPVTMGLVIDNSGSMREKRAQVAAAALVFVKTSNPQDEVFVVNFNDEYYLDTPGDFTSSMADLEDALSRIDSRGSTALYDAVVGSLDHLKKGHRDKRVLLVITDGDDDASRESFAQTIKVAEESDAAIYAIGVFSEDDRRHDRSMVRHSERVLKELTEATGGMAYFPKDLNDVTPVCEEVARDIRNQYTLGYYPTNSAKDGTFRRVEVEVLPPPGLGKLNIRSRTGYYALKKTSPPPSTGQ